MCIRDSSYNRGLDQSGKVLSNIDDRATFHGVDFAGVTQSIEDGYFNNLGVNACLLYTSRCV